MACLVFCAFISCAQVPGDRKQDIKEQAWNGEKNNKSIVSGSETIDRGLPAESFTRVLGISYFSRFPFPLYLGCH